MSGCVRSWTLGNNKKTVSSLHLSVCVCLQFTPSSTTTEHITWGPMWNLFFSHNISWHKHSDADKMKPEQRCIYHYASAPLGLPQRPQNNLGWVNGVKKKKTTLKNTAQSPVSYTGPRRLHKGRPVSDRRAVINGRGPARSGFCSMMDLSTFTK